MPDEIQELMDITDRVTAFEFLEKMKKEEMFLIACRMIEQGEQDDNYISRITLCRAEEIKHLRSFLTLEQTQNELGLSEKMLKRYINQGLTVQDQMIPRYAIEIMKKDPAYSIRMQNEYQVEKLKKQTLGERMQEIEEEIAEFEDEFGGRFKEIFKHLSAEQIEMDDDIDLIRWRDLEEELQEIRGKS